MVGQDVLPPMAAARLFMCTTYSLSTDIMEPTNSPTQGQPNPRKMRLKVAFGATFSHSEQFLVGWDWFYIGSRLQETYPKQIIRKTPL